ncbi:hypothetical protein FRC08_015635 [Ceratobasidium sp. 394]|nr:hypothetical protein FRC08_015635 [Ceratobasidium sp. 394]
MTVDELDEQLFETARQESMRDRMREIIAREEREALAGAPTYDDDDADELRAQTPHSAHSRSPSPTAIEYNEHGRLTARPMTDDATTRELHHQPEDLTTTATALNPADAASLLSTRALAIYSRAPTRDAVAVPATITPTPPAPCQLPEPQNLAAQPPHHPAVPTPILTRRRRIPVIVHNATIITCDHNVRTP